MLTFQVKNIPPEESVYREPDELDLFRHYMRSDAAKPYIHQSDAFSAIRRGENITLVAGTAAGKTLAVALPLFTGIVNKKVRRIVLMYPTIALLEDQRRVMERLAELTGLSEEVGHLLGGMSRGELIRELNKKVILTTPDEAYWFFRKNIKYNSLLIYGLCLVDTFVLDEAHLFNGLALRNLQYFFNRIFTLQKEFLCRERASLHILTATPGAGLKELNNGTEISGKSKCSDINVTFLNCSPFERTEQFEERISRAVGEGFKKILVICNSAASAHRLFLSQRGKDKKICFSPEQYLQFGRVKKDYLKNFLISRGVNEELLERFKQAVQQEEKYFFADFDKVRVTVNEEDVYLVLENSLSKLKGQVTQMLYWTYKRCDAFASALPTEQIKQALRGRHRSLADFFELLCPGLSGDIDYFSLKELVSEGMTSLLDELTDRIDKSALATIYYPDLEELSRLLEGFSLHLRESVLGRFAANYSFRIEDIVKKEGPLRRKNSSQVYLKWLKTYFGQDTELVLSLIMQGLSGAEDFRKQVEMNHVSAWGNSDYPVVLYSGSMSKQSRGGLVNFFDDMEKAVLISTSAVEVGVDFAADFLITEQCNGRALLQRFGRVGRTGRKSAVDVLVGGETYGMLSESLSGRQEMCREDFSSLVRDLFGERVYLEVSDFVDASHFLINKQLGLLGEKLNSAMHFQDNIQELSEELLAAEIVPAYGLRGNLPQIALKDEGVGKEPFHLLQYIQSDRLVASETFFEMAKADVYFNNLIFSEKFCRVGVDIFTTVENSRFLFLWQDGRWLVRKTEQARMAGIIEKIKQLKSKYRNASALLLYGDVYPKRIYTKGEEGKQEPVTDKFGVPLILKDQFFLVFPGRAGWGELDKIGLTGLDEVYYDVDFSGRSFDGENLVLLDRVQGSCLAVYWRWLQHAG